jgi:hypothetical protein
MTLLRIQPCRYEQVKLSVKLAFTMKLLFATFEVLTAVSMKFTLLCDVMSLGGKVLVFLE